MLAQRYAELEKDASFMAKQMRCSKDITDLRDKWEA
jgi:hypothetical protein